MSRTGMDVFVVPCSIVALLTHVSNGDKVFAGKQLASGGKFQTSYLVSYRFDAGT